MTTLTRKGRAFGRAGRLALLAGAAILICGPLALQPAQAATGDKPNILVIMGDDIGITNISAYSHGLDGLYTTPNIDSHGKGGRGIHRLLCRAKLYRRSG